MLQENKERNSSQVDECLLVFSSSHLSCRVYLKSQVAVDMFIRRPKGNLACEVAELSVPSCTYEDIHILVKCGSLVVYILYAGSL